MKGRLLILFGLLAFVDAAHAVDLYVNNSGSPACSDATTYANNDAANPWCTLLRASWGNTNRDGACTSGEAADAGDTVHVTQGTYNYASVHDAGGHVGPPLYQPCNSGSSGNWIVFQGLGSGATLTTTTTGPQLGNGGAIIGSGLGYGGYIEWDNFNISNVTAYSRQGSGLVVFGLQDNLKLENSTIIGTDFDSDGNNHAAVYIHGERVDDGCPGPLTGIEVRNNNISGVTGYYANDAGIIMYCVEEFTVDNNNIFDNDRGVYHKTGYNATAPATKLQSYFRKNVFYGNDIALRIRSWNKIEVSQNIFRDQNTGSIRLQVNPNFSGDNGPEELEIVNNTFDNESYVFSPYEFGAGTCSWFNNNHFYNNIVTNSTYVMDNTDDDCETVANWGQDDIDYDYNSYDHSGNFWNGGNNSNTVALFISTLSQGANQWDSVDCLYADVTNNDFRLCQDLDDPHDNCVSASPCLEGGANEGLDIMDLDNDTSTSDAITIGAYITGDEVIGPGAADEEVAAAGVVLFLSP